MQTFDDTYEIQMMAMPLEKLDVSISDISFSELLPAMDLYLMSQSEVQESNAVNIVDLSPDNRIPSEEESENKTLPKAHVDVPAAEAHTLPDRTHKRKGLNFGK